MQSVNDIRSHFLEYFRSNDHEVVSSSPLVPHNDPTLMFTNAGMVQFKNVFTGAEARAYQRASTSQKCVRAGGKHNDLDNVGYTARHHTFFEMLGNFSFGDYFKERAIELAWNLITKEFDLNAERLLVTVYAEDDDAFNLWNKITGLPEQKIIRIPTSDNFWAMGDTGPCGPCSEIFYDHGAHIPGGPPGSPDEDGDRFVEIWNLVFMQYEQVTTDERINLPKPSIDTGMGLERVAAILQGQHDNYDTDLFRNLITASVEYSNMPAEGEHAVSHRVIADHLRASSFLIADGVTPSNEGRGYVLRRIMRRAMRYAHQMGCKDPLMWRLVPTLVGEMGQAFPELGRAEALITETLKLEETRFKQTLARGLKLLGDATAKLGDGEALPGDVAFQLYDTFGFPLDLTQDALRRQGREVDNAGFETAMERQRADARKAWAGSGDATTDRVWFEVREQIGASEFLGYEMASAEGVVTAMVQDGAQVSSAAAGTEVSLIVNQTPFYGESGGQMGDSGVITTADGVRLIVNDTKKRAGDVIVHMASIESGTLNINDPVTLEIDAPRRAALRANHSATHLLHAALRRHLGDHVTQKGSLVAPDRLRFDISHPKPISDEERDAVEAEVNERIRDNAALSTRLMTPDEAVENGALALFGEKYGEEVRVVTMGGSVVGNSTSDETPYSLELCGGTHVGRVGDIGMFTIISEAAVAAGVRRIEALTGEAARRHARTQDGFLNAASAAIKSTSADLAPRIAAIIEERRQLERELRDLRKKVAVGGGEQALETKDVGGTTLLARRLDGTPPRELKPMVDAFKKKLGSGVCALVTVTDGKAALVVGVTEDLTDKISAVDLVRVGAAALGGKGGGGRPDMAQAGGPNGDDADGALQAIEKILAEKA
jgi:alanyl-tRNA synthetase